MRPAYSEIGPLEKKSLKRRGDEKKRDGACGKPPARYVREGEKKSTLWPIESKKKRI